MSNIDNLIDSAFSADKSRLPKQPAVPPASLLEQLSAAPPAATAPVSHSASVAGSAFSVTVKFALSALVVGSVAIGSYFYFKPTVTTPSQPPTILTTDTATTAVTADTIKTKKALAKRIDTVKKMQPTINPVIINPTPINESDLDLPKNPPKTYQSDSTNLHIKKK